MVVKSYNTIFCELREVVKVYRLSTIQKRDRYVNKDSSPIISLIIKVMKLEKKKNERKRPVLCHFLFLY